MNLADVYSFIDSKKRAVKGLLAEPGLTLQQYMSQIGEDNDKRLNLQANAYPMAGDKTVLNSPHQLDQFRAQLAKEGGDMAMAGMFVGPSSKTWDKVSAQKATQMEKSGADARKIWSETGTWKAPDGMWRQEIPDNKAFYDPEALSDLKLNNPNFDYLKQTQPLEGVIGHKQLFKSYPELSEAQTHFMPIDKMRGASGAWSGKHSRLTLADSPKDQKSIALHEIQHAIQDKEGWMRGGSPDANDPLVNEAARKMYADNIDAFQGEGHELLKMARNNAYRRLGGEAEARATQTRIPLDAAQRRATFPEDSYDTPIGQLIMRFQSQ